MKSILEPSTKGYFSGLSDLGKLVSESEPVPGQVALLTAMFCVGKGAKKRCFGKPIFAGSMNKAEGMREVKKWLKGKSRFAGSRPKSHDKVAGNDNMICEVKVIRRVRKGGRVIGIVQSCYQRTPESVHE